MASKLFERASYLGDSEIYSVTVGTWDFEFTRKQEEKYLSDLRRHMITALENLDDRLWWQPETSEVFYEDIEPEKPLPDVDFATWWNETLSEFIATHVIEDDPE